MLGSCVLVKMSSLLKHKNLIELTAEESTLRGNEWFLCRQRKTEWTPWTCLNRWTLEMSTVSAKTWCPFSILCSPISERLGWYVTQSVFDHLQRHYQRID